MAGPFSAPLLQPDLDIRNFKTLPRLDLSNSG
jgi:hypothetical protein